MRTLTHGAVELLLGNIVDQDADAIVNAANTGLLGGGGVDGAIHRAAGPELKEYCLALPVDEKGRRCQVGHVQTTAAGNLAARLVIHAVGPFYDERYADKAHRQLRDVHIRALEAAVSHGCRSVAFPAISTGAYRFPVESASTIAVDSVCSFLDSRPGVSLVRFILFGPELFRAFEEALQDWQAQE